MHFVASSSSAAPRPPAPRFVGKQRASQRGASQKPNRRRSGIYRRLNGAEQLQTVAVGGLWGLLRVGRPLPPGEHADVTLRRRTRRSPHPQASLMVALVCGQRSLAANPSASARLWHEQASNCGAQ